MLPTMSFASNEMYYTTISNGWLMLDKCGSFKALYNFDVNNYQQHTFYTNNIITFI